MAPSLLEIAEAPAAHITPRHPRVVEGAGWVLSQLGPRDGAVQAVRLDEGVLAGAREEIRELARERGFESVGWWLSPLSQPADAGERLGLERGETLTALALTRPLEGETAIEVRLVETLDDFVLAQSIDSRAHGWPTEQEDRPREEQESVWERVRDLFRLWLAYDDGRPVGMARAASAGDALMLVGGATLPEARGRGVYRALVQERWRAAAERGMPALVTAANGSSAPILERMGFERLGEIQVWVDRL